MTALDGFDVRGVLDAGAVSLSLEPINSPRSYENENGKVKVRARVRGRGRVRMRVRIRIRVRVREQDGV